ncbi:hypothetical protein TNCV_3315031 [Trichonephila clavipes]|nr:hypothetical protein TNCV_3315031 [Trichonephila clavipes]
MQYLDYQQPSEKDFVQPEDMSNAPTEKCLENVGKQGLVKNVGVSRFNALCGRQGCILTRTVESNQSGRFDGNESVADSFRSGAVSFKSTGAPFLVAFPLFYIFPGSTNPSGREFSGHSPSSPFTQISIVLFNIVFSMP